MSRLPDIVVEPIVRGALEEDLGLAGDITSSAVIPAGTRARVAIAARESGVLAGLQAAELAFRLVDQTLVFNPRQHEGNDLNAGDAIATIEGDARSILGAERVALNFLTHLSGIASETAKLVRAIKAAGPTVKARITCTRKTLPGLRALQKQAVALGGGINHRFGLDDAILIKDNHIAAAGGVACALRAAQMAAGHLVKIEIEVDTLEQLQEALRHGAQVILLDNMDLATLKEAVRLAAGRAVLEVSGGVTLANAAAIAAIGVDYISSGALTHSARALDIGLDFETLVR